MKADPPMDVETIFRETDLPERAMKKAVREALRRHKLLGNPIAVSEGGKVVWIPPEEIEVPPVEEDE